MTARYPARLEVITHLCGHDAPVWSVRWRPGPFNQLASCGGKRILLWEQGGSSKTWRLKDVVFNQRETTEVPLVSPTVDHALVETTWGGRIPLVQETAHSKTVRNLCWSHDGELLAAASFDATASIWEENNDESSSALPSSTKGKSAGGWRLVSRLEGHDNEVKQVAWSPNKQQAATCSRDKSVWIHTCIPPERPGAEPEYVCSGILTGHSQDVKYVIWHPVEDLLISTSYDNTIRLWTPISGPDAAKYIVSPGSGDDDDHDNEDTDGDWKCIGVLSEHNSTVWQVTLSPTGREFASCSDDKTVRIWTATADQSSTPPPPPFPKVLGVHPWIFVASTFRTVSRLARAIMDEKHQQTSSSILACKWVCTAVIAGHHDRSIYSVAWHPQEDACGDDGVRLFGRVLDETGTSQVWELLCHVPLAHQGDVNSVAWKQQPEEDGSWLLATGGDDRVIKILRYTRAS